jgi:hypothetical protein
VDDVVLPFDPFAWGGEHVGAGHDHAGWDLDTAVAGAGAVGGFVVEAHGGADRAGGPVDGEVGEEVVAVEYGVEVAVAVGPSVNFSKIQAASPAGESLSALARVCGLEECSSA